MEKSRGGDYYSLRLDRIPSFISNASVAIDHDCGPMDCLSPHLLRDAGRPEVFLSYLLDALADGGGVDLSLARDNEGPIARFGW